MSASFDFHGEHEFDQHHCEAVREGEWLVFKCPDCEYERRFHSKTGEMKVRKGQPTVLHQGQYMPTGIDFGSIHSN